MNFEIIHFRDADKILEEKAMISDLAMTVEFIFNALVGTKYRGELLREALDDMYWRPEGIDLRVLPGRRYMYKGLKGEIAIDGSLSSYEYLHTGLLRLQLGYDKGTLVSGILLLPANRGDKSPYGNTAEMLRDEMEMLFPTISMPVTICLYDLGGLVNPEEN
jgi:hypothetical protein